MLNKKAKREVDSKTKGNHIMLLKLFVDIFFRSFLNKKKFNEEKGKQKNEERISFRLLLHKQLSFNCERKYDNNNNGNNNNNNKMEIVNSWTDETKAEKFQQVKHPNDILTNLGVKLPSDQILGKC